MKKFGCFLVILIALSVTPAQAGDLTLFGGFQHQGKITLGSTASGAASFIFNPRDFGVYGGRLGLGLAGIPFLGQEHTLAVAPSFIDTNSKAIIYNSNLLLQAPLILVKPYATVGLGLVHSSGDTPSAIGTHFAVNYGGGLKFSLFGPLGGRIDVRDYTIPKVQSQTLNILEVSAGVVVAF
jgi:hypothetical protein